MRRDLRCAPTVERGNYMKKTYLPFYYPDFIARIGVWILLRCRKYKYGYTFRLIKLTQNKYAKVDAEDFEELNKYKWYAVLNNLRG